MSCSRSSSTSVLYFKHLTDAENTDDILSSSVTKLITEEGALPERQSITEDATFTDQKKKSCFLSFYLNDNWSGPIQIRIRRFLSPLFLYGFKIIAVFWYISCPSYLCSECSDWVKSKENFLKAEIPAVFKAEAHRSVAVKGS